MKNLLAFILLISIGQILNAEVFKWTDENGRVHYSTRKSNPSAQIAELPGLTKGDVTVPSSKILTCYEHGGINCAAGPDQDGSVICQDGEKNVTERFIFRCKESKIIFEGVGEINKDGNYPIAIRNKTGVKAKKVQVKYQITEDEQAALEGPAEIEAFGMEEYQLPGLYFIDGKSKPEKNKVITSCQNCP